MGRLPCSLPLLALLLGLSPSCGRASGDPVPSSALPPAAPAPSSPPAIPTSLTTATSAEPASSASESAGDCVNLRAGSPTSAQLGALGRGVRGVDVSGAAPWKDLAAAPIDFAFTQASRGLRENGAFRASWRTMKSCALARGAYHFLAHDKDGAAQASVFLAQLGDDPGELPPVADVERPLRCNGECCDLDCDAWISKVRAWIDVVGRAVKRAPMVYTMRSFWTKCLCGSTAFQSLPLWLAREEQEPHAPVDFGGWSRWTFLQDKRDLRFGGAMIDIDLFHGTRPELDALAGRGARR